MKFFPALHIGWAWIHNIAIKAGLIDGTVIGGTTPAAGTFTTLRVTTGELPSANADLVRACPYNHTAIAADITWGKATAGDREFIQIGHKYRIRQNGVVTTIKIYSSGNLTLANTTDFHFCVWRRNIDGTYNRVANSGNLIGLITAGAGTKTITLPTPITVQEGDFYGYGLSCADVVDWMSAKTGVSGASTYYTGDVITETNYPWATKTLGANIAIAIEVYMTAPQMVIIGDSIAAGHPDHFSFAEETDTTDIDGQIAYWVSSVFGGVTYQNMGIGGENTSQILARFISDVVNLKPKLAIIVGGVNDLHNSGATSGQYIINMRTMLDHCRSNNIIPVIIKTTPWTGASISQNTTSNGAADGSTFICAGLGDTDDYYVGWKVVIGTETSYVSNYDQATKTITVDPVFSAQVMSGTAYFMTTMAERDARWELLTTLCHAYPDAILIDADYVLGQNFSHASAAISNLWDQKAAYYASASHYNVAGYAALGAEIAERLKKAFIVN